MPETPIDRVVDALHRHVTTTLNTIDAGLSSAATAERALLYEVRHGGPLTRQGLEVAVHRVVNEVAPIDVDALAQALALDDESACFDRTTRYYDDLIFKQARQRYRRTARAAKAHLLQDPA